MIRHATYPFKFGYLRVSYDDDKLVSIRSQGQPSEESLPNKLSNQTFKQIQEYLAGERRIFDLPFHMQGTDFQVKVWKALLDIPYGETRSYGQIAAVIGQPRASQAIGGAVGRNPLWILVPCHRVIGSDGSLTGYAGGLAMKKALLNLESLHQDRLQFCHK